MSFSSKKIISLLMIFLFSFMVNCHSRHRLHSKEMPEACNAPKASILKTFSVSNVADADAYVDAGDPDANHGTESYLVISGQYEQYAPDWAFLHFPFTNKPSSVKDAKISLSFYDPDEITEIGVYLVSESWSESTITWNNKPAIGAQIATITPRYGQIYTIDVSNYVSGNDLSICLKYTDESATSGHALKVYSRTGYFLSSSNAPKIVWTFQKDISISISTPSSSTCWCLGTHEIKWTAPAEVEDVEIKLYKGDTFVKTISSWSDNDGSYNWYISKSDEYVAGTDYKIEISDYDDPTISKNSTNFEILYYVDEKLGEMVCKGEPLTDEFNAKKDEPHQFDYTMSDDSLTYQFIIYSQEMKVLFSEDIDSSSGSIVFTPDATEVLMVYVGVVSETECAYVKLDHYDQSERMISGYDPWLMSSIGIPSLLALIVFYKKKIN